MQGFEPTLEAIFGPQGFFPDNILGSIIKTFDEKIIQVLRDLYNAVEPHVMEVVNTPVAEMPDVLTDKAKAGTDYVYDAYNKMNTKQKRSVTDSLTERINEVGFLLSHFFCFKRAWSNLFHFFLTFIEILISNKVLYFFCYNSCQLLQLKGILFRRYEKKNSP